MATCYKAFHRRVVPVARPRVEGLRRSTPRSRRRSPAAGFRVFEVPVSYFGRSRAEGKKIRLKDGFSALAALVRHSLLAGREALSAAGLDRGGVLRSPRSRSSRCATTRGATRSRPTSRSTSSSGYLEVFGRTAIVNIEHPPLMKVLAGLGLAALPLPPPPAKIPMGNRFTPTTATRFSSRTRCLPTRSRRPRARPFSPCSRALLAAGVLRGAGALRRRRPRSSPLSLLALDPNLVAHAGVVHTDLGAALAFLADRARLGPRAGASPSAGARRARRASSSASR